MDKAILQKAVDELVLCEGNKARAARNLNMPRSTFCDMLETAQRLRIQPTKLAPDAEAKVHEVRLQYEDKLRYLNNQLAATTRDNISAQSVRKFIFGLKEHEASPPLWTLEPDSTSGKPGIPLLMLSDFHWGEVVEASAMGGINQFDMNVASARLKRAITGAIDLSFNHMINPQYPGIVVAAGGDMLSGHIHTELAETNQGPTMSMMFDLFHNMTTALTALADKFGHVVVFWTYGNHGRNTQKPSYKNSAETNFDWLLGVMLENHFKALGDDRITLVVPASTDIQFRIYNTTYLLTHGDKIGARGGDGHIGPIGPITRGIKKIKAQQAALGESVDYVIMGHWHTYLEPPGGIVNGSLKGYDEFARGHRFDPEPPLQALWWTHPTYGRTFRAPIFLEKPSGLSGSWESPISWKKL